jgi:Fe-S-cluster containining protein
VFLEPARNGRRGCRIYPVRPLQCRTWPFWTINLKSPAYLALAAETCPGINSGRQYSFDEIEQLRLKKDWE